MIQVLQKAAAVLDHVGRAGEASFTELRRATGFHKASLANLLKTLEAIGYLARGTDRRYSIGPAVLELARPALQRDELARLAEKYAGRLAEQVRELVVVAVLRNGRRYHIARASGERSITVDARLDQRPSPYDTATGRVLLANADTPSLEEVLDVNGPPGDAWPEAAAGDIHRELSSIRAAGLAEQISVDGQVKAIAVPVFDPSGRCLAAIGLSVPEFRFDAARRLEVTDALRTARDHMQDELALRLGAKPVVAERTFQP
jgi:DNA-binding IclR family transcriptional regulator